jgi:hypothetical protein
MALRGNAITRRVTGVSALAAGLLLNGPREWGGQQKSKTRLAA